MTDYGNHAWWYSARMQEWLKGVGGDEMATWAAIMPKPSSALGGRVVTSHGDFHGGNILRDLEDPTVLRVIDLEFATVYYAAHDLAYAQVSCKL